MSALATWQRFQGVDDHEAAEQLGLEVREFFRQRATRASRQTALLAVLIALFQPDTGKIAAAAAALDRRPAPPKEVLSDLCSVTDRDRR
jgi:hypothetical protein